MTHWQNPPGRRSWKQKLIIKSAHARADRKAPGAPPRLRRALVSLRVSGRRRLRKAKATESSRWKKQFSSCSRSVVPAIHGGHVLVCRYLSLYPDPDPHVSQDKQAERDGKGKLTLSGLLNALDGPTATTGRLVDQTWTRLCVNHIAMLAPWCAMLCRRAFPCPQLPSLSHSPSALTHLPL